MDRRTFLTSSVVSLGATAAGTTGLFAPFAFAALQAPIGLQLFTVLALLDQPEVYGKVAADPSRKQERMDLISLYVQIDKPAAALAHAQQSGDADATRLVPLAAKKIDEAPAEVPAPHAVHDHARGQPGRIAEDPIRQL